jgi:hypothetical protein
MSGPREKALWHKAFSTRATFCKGALQKCTAATRSDQIRKTLILQGFLATRDGRRDRAEGCHFCP